MARAHHLLFIGARDDALERLPALAVAPRLELAADRISLVGEGVRVDVDILFESGLPGEASWLLLRVGCRGLDRAVSDAMIAGLRHGGRTAAAAAH